MLPLLALLACAAVETDTGAAVDLCFEAVEAQCWCYMATHGITPEDNQAVGQHQDCMDHASDSGGRLRECQTWQYTQPTIDEMDAFIIEAAECGWPGPPE